MSRDVGQYTIAKLAFQRAVKKAKSNYRVKLEAKLGAHDSRVFGIAFSRSLIIKTVMNFLMMTPCYLTN